MAAAAEDFPVVKDALDFEGSSAGSTCHARKGQQDPLGVTATTALGEPSRLDMTFLSEATLGTVTRSGTGVPNCCDGSGESSPNQHTVPSIKEDDASAGPCTELLSSAAAGGAEEPPTPGGPQDDRPSSPRHQSPASPPEQAPGDWAKKKGPSSSGGLFAPQEPVLRQQVSYQSLCPSSDLLSAAVPSDLPAAATPLDPAAVPMEPSDPPPPMELDRSGNGEEGTLAVEVKVPDLKDRNSRAAELGRRLRDSHRTCPEALLTMLVRRPLCSILVMQFLVAGLCGALFKGGALNTDFSSFVQASSRSSLSRDAYTHAWTVSSFAPTRSRRLSSSQDAVSYIYNIVHIIYHHEDAENLLQEERLFAILQFERRLQALPEWRVNCRWDPQPNVTGQALNAATTLSEMRPSCNPGESLVNYIWPERLPSSPGRSFTGLDTHAGNKPLRLSGQGGRYMPAEVVLASFRDDRTYFNHLRRLLPKDFVPPEGGKKAHTELLQSHFLFSTSYGPEGTGARFRTAGEARAGFSTFLEDTLHPALLDGDAGLEAQGIRVFYYSSALDTLDIFHALWSDCKLALGGLVVVFIIVRVHTQSWVLSIVGLFLVLESIPVGYVFFKRFSGLQDMSIVNCLSLFVIIGIGSDLVFVLTDGWRQSATMPREVLRRKASLQDIGHLPVVDSGRLNHHQRMLRRRLVWLWGSSGASCVTTTLCSASSFLVNLGSVLAPLREFGLFMGLCVASSLLLQLSIYPLVLLALERSSDPSRGLGSVSPGSSESIVPYGGHLAVDPSMRRQGSLQILRERSFLVRFLGIGWSNFLRDHRRKILGSFLLFSLACLIGIPLSISVESGMPAVFPDTHNQVAGKLYKERFQPNMIQVAHPSSNNLAWVCDLTSPRREGNFADCVDIRDSCGTWASEGICETRPLSMQAYCKRTCAFCDYCLARWCYVDAPPQQTRTSPGQCECFEETPASNATEAPLQANQAEMLRIKAMIVGYPADAWQELEPHFTQYFQRLLPAPASWQAQSRGYTPVPSAPNEGWRQPPLVQEHWRSGSSATWPSFEAPTFSATTHDAATSSPTIVRERTLRQYCYCDGISPCGATKSSRGVIQHNLQPGSRTASQAAAGAVRRLEEDPALPPAVVDNLELTEEFEEPMEQPRWPAVAPPRRLAARAAAVNVIYGLEIQDLGPFELFVQTAKEQIWQFDSMFEPSDPWAQRSIMQMCQTLPPQLRVNDAVTAPNMWLRNFETWLRQAYGDEFPSRNFNTRVEQFVNARPEFARHFLRETDGRVRAVMNEFRLEIADSSGLGAALEVMRAWDDHVAAQNDAASIRAGRAWHTSSLWVRVEAQHSIISSTATIIFISVAVGFLAMVFFTRNCLLAILSMVSVVLIVIALLFFMVTVMQWSIGAIEVVALIVFLGYMFTFNLHIAHAYIHASLQRGGSEFFDADDADGVRRFRMARFALVAMGQSLLGSATTSVGCALFLVFCTLQFFVRFGVVILLVTVLSLIYSLVFLPAILMICGPVKSPACCGLHGARIISDEPLDAHDVEGDKADFPKLPDDHAASRGSSGDEATKDPALPLGPADFRGRLRPTEEEEV